MSLSDFGDNLRKREGSFNSYFSSAGISARNLTLNILHKVLMLTDTQKGMSMFPS